MPVNIIFYQTCNLADFAREVVSLNFEQNQTILLWLKYCVECLTKPTPKLSEFGSGLDDQQIIYSWHGGKLFEH